MNSTKILPSNQSLDFLGAYEEIEFTKQQLQKNNKRNSMSNNLYIIVVMQDDKMQT